MGSHFGAALADLLGAALPDLLGAALGSHFGAALADLLGAGAALKPRAPAPGVRVVGAFRGPSGLFAA